MGIEYFIPFLTASILLTLMPGPDNLFVVVQSLSRGAKTGIALSLGLASGVMVHTTLAATGLALVLTQSEFAFQVLSYLGAAYLFYLAYLSSQEKPLKTETTEHTSDRSLLSWTKKGVIMNVLNPKVTLFFLAFLPQFIDPEGWSKAAQLYSMGVVFMVQAFVLFSALAILAGRLSHVLQSYSFWVITKWLKVVVLTLLGFYLIVGQVL